jgi:hypothetical protein
VRSGRGSRSSSSTSSPSHLSKGARLLLPVAVEGALFSTGGRAQGHPLAAFQRTDYFIAPRWAAPQRFIATMGMPVDEQGVNQGENLNTACSNAESGMIALLQEPGYTREQAYVLCTWPPISGPATWWTCRTTWSPRCCLRTSFRRNGRPAVGGGGVEPRATTRVAPPGLEPVQSRPHSS